MSMEAKPQDEHRWLNRMLGDWKVTGSCAGEPGQPEAKMEGRESAVSLGGLWVVCEGSGQAPDGSRNQHRMVLGFDPAKGRFVGIFVASMMTHLWTYDGTLQDGKLVLEAEGPIFGSDGTTLYRDTISFESDDHRALTSHMRMPDGSWMQIMRADYHRAG